jgi:hypothetical protein
VTVDAHAHIIVPEIIRPADAVGALELRAEDERLILGGDAVRLLGERA